MPLKMKASNNQGGGFELPEAGNQPAVLVAVVELGTQESDYQGQKSEMEKVFLVWELVNLPLSGSQYNHVIGKDYSLKMGQKAALRQMLERWRGCPFEDGQDFDLKELLGKSCLVDVIHGTSKNTGRQYAKVGGVSSLPKGTTCPPPKRKPIAWEIADNDQLPERLGEWAPFIMGQPLCEVIKRSPEWKHKAVASGSHGSRSHAGEEWDASEPQDDDIPF